MFRGPINRRRWSGTSAGEITIWIWKNPGISGVLCSSGFHRRLSRINLHVIYPVCFGRPVPGSIGQRRPIRGKIPGARPPFGDRESDSRPVRDGWMDGWMDLVWLLERGVSSVDAV